MAALQAQLKRGILDELWYAAKKAAGGTDGTDSDGITLEEAIRSFKSARWADISNGTFVVNTSGGGHSASFHVPELFRQLGPDQFFILGQEFLEILADSKTLNAGASSDELFVAMLADDRLQTVRSTMLDTTSIRFPTYGPTR